MLALPSPRPARIAIIGVGNQLNGDDGAGPHVVRELAARLPATPGLLLLDGGLAPENFSGPLRRFRPDLVLQIDAADQGRPPGATAWIDWQEADGLSASTHTLPPSVFAKFLIAELGCRVALIGIQPAVLELNAPLSPAVDRACSELADALGKWLTAAEVPR
ncbi:MAG TPA: hydrogenase maturation protease [Vicinamibacterales bacterium]|nr:hydrogenase maturation protease [Acidobacteriota bacterium]HOC19719.1 hydrogenase maturation protease [Vicinamibacterales bacterium]